MALVITDTTTGDDNKKERTNDKRSVGIIEGSAMNAKEIN